MEKSLYCHYPLHLLFKLSGLKPAEQHILCHSAPPLWVSSLHQVSKAASSTRPCRMSPCDRVNDSHGRWMKSKLHVPENAPRTQTLPITVRASHDLDFAHHPAPFLESLGSLPALSSANASQGELLQCGTKPALVSLCPILLLCCPYHSWPEGADLLVPPSRFFSMARL